MILSAPHSSALCILTPIFSPERVLMRSFVRHANLSNMYGLRLFSVRPYLMPWKVKKGAVLLALSPILFFLLNPRKGYHRPCRNGLRQDGCLCIADSTSSSPFTREQGFLRPRSCSYSVRLICIQHVLIVVFALSLSHSDSLLSPSLSTCLSLSFSQASFFVTHTHIYIYAHKHFLHSL